jgi:hypothetical protein
VHPCPSLSLRPCGHDADLAALYDRAMTSQASLRKRSAASAQHLLLTLGQHCGEPCEHAQHNAEDQVGALRSNDVSAEGEKVPAPRLFGHLHQNAATNCSSIAPPPLVRSVIAPSSADPTRNRSHDRPLEDG